MQAAAAPCYTNMGGIVVRDYAFGNRLSALRQERGYSQFQLASLVHVSDKAVSKWETGSATPRMNTGKKLAAVLGVDLDDLFGQNERNSSAGGYVMNKELLWNAAEERLYNLYGKSPDLSIINRFKTEKNYLQGTDAIVLFSAIARAHKIAEGHHSLINARGMLNGSFIAWLTGATLFNPLLPHTRCPMCHSSRIQFVLQ